MSPLRVIYLLAALAGAVVPGVALAPWAAQHGFGVLGLAAALSAPPPAPGLAWSLLIALAAFSVWAVAETWVRRNWLALAGVLAGWALGLAVGLPLYLFFRARPVS